MRESTVLDVLSGTDHQAALAIIDRLGDCQTRENLNQILKSALIPLMDCNGAFYVRLEGKQNKPQVVDDINLSSLCQHSWKNFLDVAKQTQLLANFTTVEETKRLATDAFCCISQHCQHCSFAKSCHKLNRCCVIMALFDAPRSAVALYFCRLNPHQQSYSLRDFELLQILHATLLQTIKLIMIQEEYRDLQLMMDHLSGHIDPLAVVRDDGSLVYKNQAFDQTEEQKKLTFLSTLLTRANNAEPGKTGQHCLLSQLGRRLYEVMLTPINNGADNRTRLYLLRFSRVTNKNEQISRQLDSAGLTNRELEIAALIYQGIPTRNISEKLNLSYHTVRNHIKHIYSKIDVSSRSEMLTWGG